jgi:hypothetical protein
MPRRKRETPKKKAMTSAERQVAPEPFKGERHPLAADIVAGLPSKREN